MIHYVIFVIVLGLFIVFIRQEIKALSPEENEENGGDEENECA